MKSMALVAGVLLALSTGAQGTQIKRTPLAELVAQAEYIVVGKVVKVDIVDAAGHELADPNARTGPMQGNTIRLHVVVERRNIIKGDRKKIPTKLIVPEWPEWHATLGNEQRRAAGKSFIFLLKGKDYSPVSAPESVRDITERVEIEKLVK